MEERDLKQVLCAESKLPELLVPLCSSLLSCLMGGCLVVWNEILPFCLLGSLDLKIVHIRDEMGALLEGVDDILVRQRLPSRFWRNHQGIHVGMIARQFNMSLPVPALSDQDVH